MSWSNQSNTNKSLDLETLEQNYKNAELAYTTLKRDYNSVLTELEETKQQLTDNQKDYLALKKLVITQSQEINQALTQHKTNMNELKQTKADFEQELAEQVKQEIIPYRKDMLRMDRLVEYLPLFFALVTAFCLLYVLFRK